MGPGHHIVGTLAAVFQYLRQGDEGVLVNGNLVGKALSAGCL